MSYWFILNSLLFLLTIFMFLTSKGSAHILFGIIGLLFYLYNWTRHAMFSTIRSNISRERKIKFAQISKRALPLHRWTGTAALLFITIHAFYIIILFGFNFYHLKFLTGFLAAIILLFLVTTGWLRLFWPSPLKRQLHLKLGLSLFFLIIIHLLV